jgi:hypothetical protein
LSRQLKLTAIIMPGWWVQEKNLESHRSRLEDGADLVLCVIRKRCRSMPMLPNGAGSNKAHMEKLAEADCPP